MSIEFSPCPNLTLQGVEPLLCDNSEIRKYIIRVSMQRLGKHVPREANRRATIEVLLETGVSTQSVPRNYKEETWVVQVNFVRESVKRGLQRVKLKYLHC
jgi:hypothetical protein